MVRNGRHLILHVNCIYRKTILVNYLDFNYCVRKDSVGCCFSFGRIGLQEKAGVKMKLTAY